MLSRPRSIERKVAERLSLWFEKLGMSNVKRIPILGRTGPDIEVNEFKLVVDVKSRKEVPLCWYRFPLSEIVTDGTLYGVKLAVIKSSGFPDQISLTKRSNILEKYYGHMDEWVKDYVPNGITTIILHRPGTKIDSAVLILNEEGIKKVKEAHIGYFH